MALIRGTNNIFPKQGRKLSRHFSQAKKLSRHRSVFGPKLSRHVYWVKIIVPNYPVCNTAGHVCAAPQRYCHRRLVCLCKPQGSGVLTQRCGNDTECPNIYVFPKLARWFQVGTNAAWPKVQSTISTVRCSVNETMSSFRRQLHTGKDKLPRATWCQNFPNRCNRS